MEPSVSTPSVFQIQTGGGHYIGAPLNAGGHIIFGDQVNTYSTHEHITQVIAMPIPNADERYKIFLKANKNPFLPERPYTVFEAPIFTGRDKEIIDVINHVSNNQFQATVVYGEVDVGKTSLLTGGVIPRLRDNGALVIYQSDYAYPLLGLHNALVEIAKSIHLDLAIKSPLSESIKMIVGAASRGIVLILDQFERYYLSAGKADDLKNFKNELMRAIRGVNQPGDFHIVISIRDDLRNRLFEEWGESLPGLCDLPIDLFPLDKDQAFKAFARSLQEVKNTAFNEDFIRKQFMSDLDQLDGLETNSIQPSDFQIVSYELFQAAHSKDNPLIDKDLYNEISEKRGAVRIIDRHFDELMGRLSNEYRQKANEIVFRMSDKLHDQLWFTPLDVMTDAKTADGTERVMDEMSRHGLLIWHYEQRGKAYCFASNTIANWADRALGPEAHARRQAKRDLDFVWRAWVNADEIPNRGMLSFFEKYIPHGSLPIEYAFLLLRSSIQNSIPLGHWLLELNCTRAKSWIQQFEADPNAQDVPAEEITPRQQARELLGIDDANPPPRTDRFGPLSWSAASRKKKNQYQEKDKESKTESRTRNLRQAVTCEVASLSLLTAFGSEALSHLEAAVEASGAGSARLIELTGILADSSPEIATGISHKPLLERLGV